MNAILKWYIFCLIQGHIYMQNVQLYGPTYAIKDRPIGLNCSSNTVPEGNTAEFLVNGKSVNNVRLHQTRCFRTVDVIVCVPGVCQCSSDGRTFVFYYTPNQTGEYSFSCRMKFTSNMSSEAGKFGTYNIVTYVIEPTPLIKTEKNDNQINLTCSVVFIDITTVFKWECNDEPIMSESLHNTTTSWSVVSIELSYKKSTSLCFCSVSLPVVNFTASTAARLEYKDTISNESLFCNISTPIKLTCSDSARQDSNVIWKHQINTTCIRLIPANDPELRTSLFIKSCTLQDMGVYSCFLNSGETDVKFPEKLEPWRTIVLQIRGRPELLHNQVVYLGSDVVFSLTFYSSKASNTITWYRQWIRLINSTIQVQSTKPTTLNVLVRGKNVSIDGFRSSLVLRNVKEHNLYNIKICVKNDYGKSCHSYLQSKEKEMQETFHLVYIIAVVVVIVCVIGLALLFYRQRSGTSTLTEYTTNPVYYSVENQQNNEYQPPLANREDVHAYETPSAVYEQLNEDRPLHEYNIASQYEEINTTAIDVYSIENRNSYEKIDDILEQTDFLGI